MSTHGVPRLCPTLPPLGLGWQGRKQIKRFLALTLREDRQVRDTYPASLHRLKLD